MVKLMRVDDRRIHGQVAIAWSKALEFKVLMVASDVAAASKTQTMALKMAGPPSSKTTVQSIEQTIKTLNDPRSANTVIGIIVTNLADALAIAKGATDQVKRINFGNYGRLNGGDVAQKKKLSDNVYVDEEDLKIIDEMKQTGIPIDVQLLPYMAMVTLDDVLK